MRTPSHARRSRSRNTTLPERFIELGVDTPVGGLTWLVTQPDATDSTSECRDHPGDRGEARGCGDDPHHILSLAGPPHTRGASTSPFSMSPHRGAWIMSFREDSITSARWTTTTSAPNNPSISSIAEIARCIILTSSQPPELTACTSPNATYSFSDVMGHSQVRVVERRGGYGVLNKAAASWIRLPTEVPAAGVSLTRTFLAGDPRLWQDRPGRR